jgi:prevent-host-death family protein
MVFSGGTMRNAPKFSEDVVPLTDLKTNPGRVVRQVDETRRPVLLTSRGRGVAVVQALSEYEAEAEERSFLRAVVEGIVDLEAGRELDLADVKQRFGLD